MTHLHTKPFNIEHAKDGAPVGTRNGYGTVEILKYGKDRIFGLIADEHGNESIEYWQLDGAYGLNTKETVLDLVMLPLGYCEDKPVFVGDSIQGDGEVVMPAFVGIKFNGGHHWKWPKPKAKYPETKCTAFDLDTVWQEDDGSIEGTSCASESACIAVANYAIAHAIQDGDVFTRPQVSAAIKAIIDIATRHTNSRNIINAIEGSDWDAVMKAVLK